MTRKVKRIKWKRLCTNCRKVLPKEWGDRRKFCSKECYESWIISRTWMSYETKSISSFVVGRNQETEGIIFSDQNETIKKNIMEGKKNENSNDKLEISSESVNPQKNRNRNSSSLG